jgi:hypothetical protein
LHYDEANSYIQISLAIHSTTAPTLLGNGTACPSVSCSLEISDQTISLWLKVVPVSDGYQIVTPSNLWYYDGVAPDPIQPGTCTLGQTSEATKNMQAPWRDIIDGVVLPCVKPTA